MNASVHILLTAASDNEAMDTTHTELDRAYTELYDKYAPQLRRRAQVVTGNHDLSEDAVQDVFLKTWLYLAQGGQLRQARAFLYRVLNNVIIDEYRRRKALSLDAFLEQGFGPAVDDTDILIDMIDGDAAMRLIDKLPHKYRHVMRMKYAYSMSLEEMSRLSGQSKNVIGVRAHRGLLKLRTLYPTG
jgi:RNA polymerase sigma-70 factor, ECF subfamily